MKTKSNMTVSKLQSEAVLEFKSKYPKYKYLCRYSDDFKKGEWINIEDVFKFYNDQIQKAYEAGYNQRWRDEWGLSIQSKGKMK